MKYNLKLPPRLSEVNHSRQTIQWPKEKKTKRHNDLQNTTQKAKD